MGGPNSGRRPGFRHTDACRAKIQTSAIISRLQQLIAGEADMAPHAVTAAVALLRKTLPDLSAVEATVEQTQRFVMALPPVAASEDEWLKQIQ